MKRISDPKVEIRRIDGGALDYAYYDRAARRARAIGMAQWFNRLFNDKKNSPAIAKHVVSG